MYDRESDNPSDKKKSNPDKPTTYTYKNVKDSMQFTVDTTAPDISNIANLDQQIIDAQEVDVKYSLVDIGGLSSVEVYVDGETVDSITDFSKNRNDYSGEFTINEKNEAQTVRIKVTDLAGNVTDTKSEEFSSGDKYVFVPDGWEVSVQDKGYYLFEEPRRQFSLRPDIVIRKNDRVVVLDTKWKSLCDNEAKNYGISQSDMYQMYAYSKKYQTSEIWLIYPVNQEMRSHRPIRFDSGDGTRVNVFLVDVTEMESSLTILKDCICIS